jgi:hypothetical protein
MALMDFAHDQWEALKKDVPSTLETYLGKYPLAIDETASRLERLFSQHLTALKNGGAIAFETMYPSGHNYSILTIVPTLEKGADTVSPLGAQINVHEMGRAKVMLQSSAATTNPANDDWMQSILHHSVGVLLNSAMSVSDQETFECLHREPLRVVVFSRAGERATDDPLPPKTAEDVAEAAQVEETATLEEQVEVDPLHIAAHDARTVGAADDVSGAGGGGHGDHVVEPPPEQEPAPLPAEDVKTTA